MTTEAAGAARRHAWRLRRSKMGRWLALLVLGLPNLVQFALAQTGLEVTELKGGSVMTDIVSANDWTHPIRWVVINQSSCPVRLENSGVILSYHAGYSYSSRGVATSQSQTAGLEVRFLLFDAQGKLIRALSYSAKANLDPGGSFLLDRLGPWKATHDEVEKFAVCVSFVTRAHFPDGKEWSADTVVVNRALRDRSFTLGDESRLIR
jgi:hypothetical protein